MRRGRDRPIWPGLRSQRWRDGVDGPKSGDPESITHGRAGLIWGSHVSKSRDAYIRGRCPQSPRRSPVRTPTSGIPQNRLERSRDGGSDDTERRRSADDATASSLRSGLALRWRQALSLIVLGHGRAGPVWTRELVVPPETKHGELSRLPRNLVDVARCPVCGGAASSLAQARGPAPHRAPSILGLQAARNGEPSRCPTPQHHGGERSLTERSDARVNRGAPPQRKRDVVGWRAVNTAGSVSLHRAFLRHKRREVRPGMVRSSVSTAPGWGSNGERVARRELRSRRDTRGEAPGAESACETSPRDARSNATWLRPDTRHRTPTAAPVEAAGAATRAEHASASERGAGGDPKCKQPEPRPEPNMRAWRRNRHKRNARGTAGGETARTKSEMQGVDSACETSPCDARSDATWIRSDAGRRTPTADPVETVGAATEGEHPSASEGWRRSRHKHNTARAPACRPRRHAQARATRVRTNASGSTTATPAATAAASLEPPPPCSALPPGPRSRAPRAALLRPFHG